MKTIEAALKLLTAEDHPTLLDIWKIIDDPVHRQRLILRFDFNIANKWEWLVRGGGLSETSIQSALWRLEQFLDIEIARASTCHPDKLDLYSLIRQNKIILVSVHANEGIVPKSAQNVLGAIILSQIQMAAMSGAVADPKTRPFMLYVDEVQDFATCSLTVALPNAMKVPELMDEFFQWLHSLASFSPLTLVADAHYKLVRFHPFVDGNGRTARLLMNLLLMQAGYPPAAI